MTNLTSLKHLHLIYYRYPFHAKIECQWLEKKNPDETSLVGELQGLVEPELFLTLMKSSFGRTGIMAIV